MLCIILGQATISVMYILLSPYVSKQLPTPARFEPDYSFSNSKGLATVPSCQDEIDDRWERKSKQYISSRKLEVIRINVRINIVVFWL